MLSTGALSEKDIKTVGSISNDFEKLTLDEKGHMAAKFNNSVRMNNENDLKNIRN